MFNLLAWAKLPSPLERFHKKANVEAVADSLGVADSIQVPETEPVVTE
jgi:hypothetical protein